MKVARVVFAAVYSGFVMLAPSEAGAGQPAAPQSTAFKIVVISGEDAVNIIQQKTAVAPVVEVRDRNNLPIPGVAVTFTIGGGQGASFGGLSTLTVTTKAAGQAAAASLTPTAAGAIQINAAAVFQGQTVVATIAQTNVLTAAQAAAAGAGAGGGAGATGSAGGAAAGGGGGISGTTIGIVGAAVGGGALVATQVGGGSDPAPTAAPPTPTPAPQPTTYVGSYVGRGQTTNSATNPSDFVACVETLEISGTLTMKLQQGSDGQFTGSATTTLQRTDVALSSSCPASMLGRSSVSDWNLTVTGTAQSLAFNGQLPITGTQPGSRSLKFSGRLENNVISGTMLWEEGFGGLTTGTPAIPFTAKGSATFEVTLR